MENKSKNQFISGNVDGITAVPVAAPPDSIRFERPARHTNVTSTDTAERSRQQVINEVREKQADGLAEIISRDQFGRKIELHAAGWETAQNIHRVFAVGQTLMITHAFSVGVYLRPTVSDGNNSPDPSYSGIYNTPEAVAKATEYVDKHGVIFDGMRNKVINDRTHVKCKVIGRPDGRTITVGQSPMYELEITHPGDMAGLRILLSGSSLYDESGKDGYGSQVFHKVA